MRVDFTTPNKIIELIAAEYVDWNYFLPVNMVDYKKICQEDSTVAYVGIYYYSIEIKGKYTK